MNDTTLVQEILANKTLVWLFVSFVVFVGFAFRPGTRKIHRDIANIPFRNEDRPSPEPQADATQREART
jgi:cytochrome c oxidase cbb3-type subunit 4